MGIFKKECPQTIVLSEVSHLGYVSIIRKDTGKEIANSRHEASDWANAQGVYIIYDSEFEKTPYAKWK